MRDIRSRLLPSSLKQNGMFLTISETPVKNNSPEKTAIIQRNIIVFLRIDLQVYPRLRCEGLCLGFWGWGFVKSLLPPAAAKYSFVRHIIFMISLREIMKMMCLTKYNSARSAVKRLLTQPQPQNACKFNIKFHRSEQRYFAKQSHYKECFTAAGWKMRNYLRNM